MFGFNRQEWNDIIEGVELAPIIHAQTAQCSSDEEEMAPLPVAEPSNFVDPLMDSVDTAVAGH